MGNVVNETDVTLHESDSIVFNGSLIWGNVTPGSSVLRPSLVDSHHTARMSDYSHHSFRV